MILGTKTIVGRKTETIGARLQRRATGRRVLVVLAAFVLTLTGLAAPAHAAGGVEVFVTASGGEIPSGKEMGVGLVVGADPSLVDLDSVRIVTTLPDGVTYVGQLCGVDKCEDGPCEATGSTVTCTIAKASEPTDPNYNFTLNLRFVGAPGTSFPISATITGQRSDGTQAEATSQDTVRIVDSSDVGIKVVNVSGPSGPKNTVKYTYVLHNYGPRTVSAGDAVFFESGVPQGLGLYGFKPAKVQCFQDTSGPMSCGTDTKLAPGQETRATRTLAVPADSALWGKKVTITASVFDYPPGLGGDPSNNKVQFELDFTGKAAPGKGEETGNGEESGGTGGGLPVTGAPALTVAIGGLALLVAGAGALLLTRRRRLG